MKVKLIIIALALASLFFLPLCKAQYPNAHIYAYTDKPYYNVGDTVTLKFWIMNTGTEDLILDNVSLTYPWYDSHVNFGNATIAPANIVIHQGGNWSDTFTFTVPNDGRATGGSIGIYAVLDKTTAGTSVDLNVLTVPTSIEDTGTFLTWFIILVAIILICTLIIAAALFMSKHRTPVMTKLPP